MNQETFLIETILSLKPVEDIYKAIKFAQILFSLKESYNENLATLSLLENNVYNGLPLKICYELYYTYQKFSLNHLINYRTTKGKIIKIPLSDLRNAMRIQYFAVVELVFKSGIMSQDFDIGDSGDLSYKTKKRLEEK